MKNISKEKTYLKEIRRIEHVRILDFQGDAELKAGIALCLSQKYEKDFCRYCMGMCADNHTEVVPGEQME